MGRLQLQGGGEEKLFHVFVWCEINRTKEIPSTGFLLYISAYLMGSNHEIYFIFSHPLVFTDCRKTFSYVASTSASLPLIHICIVLFKHIFVFSRNVIWILPVVLCADSFCFMCAIFFGDVKVLAADFKGFLRSWSSFRLIEFHFSSLL